MEIRRDDTFGGAVLVCAVRYCLGRHSYMPGLVRDELAKMLKDMPDTVLSALRSDIKDYFKMDAPLYRHETDYGLIGEREWAKFLSKVEAEIADREKENND